MVRPMRSMGKLERAAYERQERDLRAAYGARWNDPAVYGDPSLSAHPKGYWYDADAAERVVQFIESFCRHHKGEWAGKPLLLEDWQKFGLRVTYGWTRADGSRRFRISYREVPRKNGKTELAAGEGLYLLMADSESGAEVYSSATKEDQAKIVWDAARAMVKQHPDLNRFIDLRQKAVVCERMAATFKPLGADSDTLDGLNPHGHVADELHAHKKRGVWDVILSGMGARRQPLTVVITTAGTYDPESIGWEQHEHARKVLEGIVEDDSYFAIIFTLDEGDAWDDPAVWAKANPNLGVSVYPDYLVDQAQRAKMLPSALNEFLRKHLNVWTQQVTRWIPVEKWNDCAGDGTPLEALAGRDAYLGIDLSAKVDLTALCIDVPDGDTHRLYWKCYVPAGMVRQRAIEKKTPDYAAWVRDGWLTEIPGDVIDLEVIRRDILTLRRQLTIRQIAYDPWGAGQLMVALEGDGFSRDPEAKKEQLVEIRQGYRSLSEPAKALEALVMSGKLQHGDNPVLRWMVDNVAIRRDPNDNIAPDKRAATGKIDGVLAAIMALGRAILSPTPTRSVYESRGIRSF